MNDRPDTSGLHGLLERATDRVAAPDLAERALIGARRRTKVRRWVAIGGAAAVAVVVVVGAAIGMQQDAESTRPATATTSTTSATPRPTQPAIDPALIQPKWDPRNVDELPPADLGIDVPAVVAPPESAPLLSDAPIGYALAAVQRQTVVKVLSADGDWRSVPLDTNEPATTRLSPGGQQLAIGYGGRIQVWTLSTGTKQTIEWPDGFRNWDFASLGWLDEATLLLDDAPGGFLLDVESAKSTRVPYPRLDDYWWAVDPAGEVVESRDLPVEPGFVDWSGGHPRVVHTGAVGHLGQLGVSRDQIAGTTYDGAAMDGFAAFVLDRATGEPTAALPLGDFEGNYSNWGLSVEALRSDGTVLMNVASIDDRPGTGEWRLVAWDPETGALGLVTRFITRDTDVIIVSRDALG